MSRTGEDGEWRGSEVCDGAREGEVRRAAEIELADEFI